MMDMKIFTSSTILHFSPPTRKVQKIFIQQKQQKNKPELYIMHKITLLR